MPLDPQVDALLTQLAAAGAPPLQEQTVADARAGMVLMRALDGEPIAVAAVNDISIPVDAEGTTIGGRVYTPEGEGPHPVVVFFHGGGWVIGDLDSHDNTARAIARDASAVVVAVDYRLAPEHRFPTAPYDCYAATAWVAEHAAELGADGSRLALCGDSAGGNLSAVVSQLARERGGPAIAFTALIYPAVDMTATGGSIDENAKGFFLERETMDWFGGHYIDASQHGDVLASPLLNPDLSGLPPAFITTAEFDPLRDQGEAYGAALAAAGVSAEVKRYDGLIHAVANMTVAVDGGRQMVADVADRLRAALHGA